MRPDRRRVVRRAAIRDVVAVDRRDDDVREAHLRRRLREPERLERVRRPVRLARVDVAVAARARARVAEDLERRRPAPPALADVRAARLLADRDEPALAHEALHLEVARVRARRAHLHPLGPARALGDGQRLLHRRSSLETVVPEAPLERTDNGSRPVGRGLVRRERPRRALVRERRARPLRAVRQRGGALRARSGSASASSDPASRTACTTPRRRRRTSSSSRASAC